MNSTHDPALKSFIDVAVDSDFPVQNLPYGVFSYGADSSPRIGVAIGDVILDLSVLEQAGLLVVPGQEGIFAQSSLNAFMALGPKIWTKTRARISELLRADTALLRDDDALRSRALVPRKSARMYLPIKVSGYTDFFSSKEHATNTGRMFRGEAKALHPNWSHMPIAYNGRASTVVVGGTAFHRPNGQLKFPDSDAPGFGPSQKLDFELEMAAVLGGASPMGKMLTEVEAEDMIFGFALLNDWSARDVQSWETVPLGPFQGKAFATSLSPWIVTREALEPFRVAGPAQEPAPLPYLRQSGLHNYNVQLEVGLKTAKSLAEAVICRSNFSYLYWSPVQQLLHHASSGCAMNVGDLLGSGTISGPSPDQLGCMLELSENGVRPLALPNGETRAFLADGDSVIMRGWCDGEGYRIGFGELEGTVLPALR